VSPFAPQRFERKFVGADLGDDHEVGSFGHKIRPRAERLAAEPLDAVASNG
jgi:hypothetical protein